MLPCNALHDSQLHHIIIKERKKKKSHKKEGFMSNKLHQYLTFRLDKFLCQQEIKIILRKSFCGIIGFLSTFLSLRL